MKSINESRKKRNEKQIDDFDVFGDIVARKLRGLRTHYAQCTVQHLINNLLYDGELGKYDSPPQPYHTRSNNNYVNESAALTSMSYSNPTSIQTVSGSSTNNSKYYHDESSSTSIISYSNPPCTQNVTAPTPELWEIGENENPFI